MEHIEQRTTSFDGRGMTPLSTVSWRAVLAGTAVVLPVNILLTMLGLAIGITTLDPNTTGAELRGAGIGVGIWYAISTIISVFIGAFIAGIASRDTTKTLGAIEGLLVWAVGLLLVLFLVTGGVESLMAQASGAMAVSPSQMSQMQIPQNLPSLSGQTASTLASASAWVAWIAFFALLLSSLAGVLGGMAGAGARKRKLIKSTSHRTEKTTAPISPRPREA